MAELLPGDPEIGQRAGAPRRADGRAEGAQGGGTGAGRAGPPSALRLQGERERGERGSSGTRPAEDAEVLLGEPAA